MMPDFNRAAVKAAETLMKYGIKTAPVAPLPILEQMENVIVISFSDICESSGSPRMALLSLLGKNKDAVSSIHTEGGKSVYVVAYNSLLPFAVIQRALAREMGHIVLGHDSSSPENEQEALCFANHLLCPRPLIHAIQMTGIRITADLLANLTGVFDRSLFSIRRVPETIVPAGLNHFVRNQFMSFIVNFFCYYRSVMPEDGSAMVDFGSYMDGYEE